MTLEELANQITGKPTDADRGAVVDLNFYNKAILSALRAAEQEREDGDGYNLSNTYESYAATIRALAQGGE